MRFFSHRNLTILIMSGIVLGVIVGLMAQGPYSTYIEAVAAHKTIVAAGTDAVAPAKPAVVSFVESIKVFGDLFIAMLKMVVVPIVLFSIVSGVANLGGGAEVGRKLFKTLAYFLLTSFLAVFVGMFFVILIQPGAGLDKDELFARLPASVVESAQNKQGEVAMHAPETISEFIQVQMTNIFMNPFKAMAEMNLISIVFFGLLLGFMIMLMGEEGKPARDFFHVMNEALMKMVQIVIWIAPIGILGLAANLLMALGPDVIAPLIKYFLTVVLGLATQLLIVYPLLLWVLAKYNPLKFFFRMKEVILLAVSTSSSAATLPVTMRVAKEEVGVDEESVDLVLPMGATINMDGTALYEAVAAIFIAQLIGIEMTVMTQILVFFTATLAAIGAAGIPQAGLVTMVVVFNAIGLPLEMMALIIVVDRPLDHLRTIVNVCGDTTGAVFLSATEGKLVRT